MRAGSVAASSLVVDLGGICVVSSQFRAPFGEAAYGIFRIGFPVRDEAIEMLHFRCQMRQRFGIRGFCYESSGTLQRGGRLVNTA